MSKMDDEFIKKLIQSFYLESKDRIYNISDYLLELEKTKKIEQNKKMIESIYREIHTLKSASRSVNFQNVEQICQKLEDVFYFWKTKSIIPNAVSLDIVHKINDIILNWIEQNTYTDIDITIYNQNEIISELTNLTKESQTNENVRDYFGVNDYKLKEKEGEKSLLLNGVKINKKNKKLQKSKDIKQKTNFIDNAKNVNVKKLNEDDIKIRNKNEEKTKEMNKEFQTKNTIKKSFEFDTIKIAANKLDNLFIQAEEMLPIKINLEEKLEAFNNLKNDIIQAKKEWEKLTTYKEKKSLTCVFKQELFSLGQNQLKNLLIKMNNLNSNFESDLHNLNLKIDNLLDDSKKILMWPFSTLLNIFPKIVRDLARNLNKEVNIEIVGAEIEIDKRMLEALKDVFVHLIRNSIDHGIELPNERTKKNKNASGNITILVQQPTANEIIIKIIDDGAGINLDLVKKSALKKGYIDNKDINNLNNEEAIDLIFKSGVSTNTILTDLSGRGLGMSIIKEKIENISGHLSVESELDKGTLITIKLPLSIATFKGTVIKSSQQTFIIPTNNLEKILRKQIKDLGSVQNQKVINYRDKNLSLLWLSDILGLSREKKQDNDYVTIAILSNGEKKMAFVVDEILNEHEIIVKNFSKPLTKIRYISAASILGSNTLVPILNITDLLETMYVTNVKIQNEIDENETSNLKHILLVEDSITTRNLLKNILELSGYQVTAAVDGMEAWNLIGLHPYSIVVSDVDMPNMNGFDLTEKIRNDNKYEDLPIILVTSRETSEDKARGIEAGADAYLTKSTFDSSYMLDIISRLAKNK